ncbi:cleavage and polyadenylation specificity factor subunit 1 [Culicoides brevitarsis]|uniref:cleavage and polyadenylation specificity factor subunit 1 n=1 Tax=Culicoides brevitarsis TaxID=469753 RepID=UPI00307C3A9B
MFSICKQTHPATGIEHSITCHFFNNVEESLVTAGANILKVYRMRPDVDPSTSNEKYSDLRPPNMRLECLATYTLFGNVMSLQSVSLTGSPRDALLISFSDAKLSVVQHDPDTYELKTLSLHYFEEEDIRGGWTGNYHIPIVRVDPDNRCAVMLVYGRKLVVLPFRKDTGLDEIEITDVKPMKKTPTAIITKTPILASYIITLKDLDERIDNVIDIQFLHGYYEPTLLVLYEPVRTFPGRIAVRQDSCMMVALSLNIQQRVHPVIWSVQNLPFDCFKAIPLKKPINGCLVMANNALIYLNQSVPPYGVSLNSIADHSTAFPLKPQDGVKISLDCAQVEFIDNDKLVLSLNNGELYVLTLCADSMRSVRSFHFSKAASSVLTCCICVCQEEYLFLGSRLGNSLLLHFKEKDESTVITIDDTDGIDKEIVKRPRLEQEEFEVYGTGQKTSVQLTSYVFEVCDSLLNIGPLSHMAVGLRMIADEHAEDTPEESYENIHLEILAASGHAKNGALTVLQSSLKPQSITSFDVSGSLDVWTVVDESVKRPENGESSHAFMILTQDNSTMVLQTGQEINEIQNTGFACNLPTIHVGNVGNNRYIVQVTTKSVRLLQGTRIIQNIPIDVGFPVTSCSIADPYVCIRTQNGQVITLALRDTKGMSRLAVNKNTISSSPPIIGMCCYKDVSGLFTTKMDHNNDFKNAYSSGFGAMKSEKVLLIDDEEDLLYGESGNAMKMNSMADMVIKATIKNSDWWRRLMQVFKPTYWVFVTRDNGNMEIYSMPDLKLTYLVNNVGNGNHFLADSMEFVPIIAQTKKEPGVAAEPQAPQAPINYNNVPVQESTMPREIFVVGLGHCGSRPLLFIRLDNQILVYGVYRYGKGHLKIRFVKINHDMLYYEAPKSTVEDLTDDDTFKTSKKNVMKFRFFNNVANMSGLAICGEQSYFVFMTARGELRTHRLYANNPMRTFAAFNNINCPNGFIYFDDSNTLQISILPTYLTYDSHWPIRKIPMRCTPGHVVYHNEHKVYCVCLNHQEVSNKYFRFNGEDKESTEENKGERFVYPTVDKFEIVLVSPETWEIVPETNIDLDEWEHVISLKNVSLAYEGALSGLKEYIAVGTNYTYSEDITSRGRILLYDIIEVVPEPGKPMTKFKFKEVLSKDQKGPVSAITHVLGLLVCAVGQKIYLFQLKDNDISGVAFIDANIYIHEMVSVKSLILVADMYQSISILRFQEEYRTLSVVSRDFNRLNVYGIEFAVDNNNLGFIATDDQANILIYMYQPESRESFGGQKLIKKADYHLGQKINAMFRVQCDFREMDENKRNYNYDGKHVTIFSTLDGGLGYLVPLPEKTYRRLFMLQNVLVTHIPHLGGLNPKAYRTIRTMKKGLNNPARCIVDGELVWHFNNLPAHEKHEVAKKIGTKVDEILGDLLELNSVTSLF